MNKHTSTWRPNLVIRGKSIGLATHSDRVLVCEVLDDSGTLKGWCPIGGGIEFGETAEEALKREVFEELGCGIEIKGVPFVCENIFEHHGVKGHEIIFAFPIDFDDQNIYSKKRFQIIESRGTTHWVEWIDIENFQNKKEVLFPEAIVSHVSCFLPPA